MKAGREKPRGDETPVTGGVGLPARLRRALPPKPSRPTDPLDRQIVRMQRLHPDMGAKFRGMDLEKMDAATKAKLLADMQRVLAVKPLVKPT